jgi:hypothetical protein
MSEIDIIFKEVLEENDIIIPLTFAEKILAKSEETFKGYNESELSRIEDEEYINDKIKELEIQLRKYKNIKNHKLSHLNSGRSKKRNEIKCKIANLKLKLQDIDMERKQK